MSAGRYNRIKNWTRKETVAYDDLNAEFNNVIAKSAAPYLGAYSDDVSQMQETQSPGSVGSEVLPTTVAEELKALRYMLKLITGETQWYTSPDSTIAELFSLITSGIAVPQNRISSGRKDANNQPMFLVPAGASAAVTLDCTPTNFAHYIANTLRTFTADIQVTGLTTAPSSNNTCLVNDANAADQDETKYLGENGTVITIDTIGTEISNLNGKLAAFKMDNGSTTEYFLAQIDSTNNRLQKAQRGYFFSSADAHIPRIVFSNNDTITLLKLTWVFATYNSSVAAVDVTYNQPSMEVDQPSSPSIGDWWYDITNVTWKRYNGTTWVTQAANLVGVCIQDTSNCVGARSFDFFKPVGELNTFKLERPSANVVKSVALGSKVSVYGTTYSWDKDFVQWDMAGDLDTGAEASSTRYFCYITDTGNEKLSAMAPHDRTQDLLGWYHPAKPWRCVGEVKNDGSSNLEQNVDWYTYSPDFRAHGKVVSVSSYYPVTAFDGHILCDATSAAFSALLPPASTVPGKVLVFKKTDSTLNAVTIDGADSETIDDATTTTLNTKDETIAIKSIGSGWEILWRRIPLTETSYTPALTASSSNPSIGTGGQENGRWWRIGARLYAEVSIRFGTAGTGNGSGNYRIGLPTSLTIDSARLPAGSLLHAVVGTGYVFDDSANDNFGVAVIAANSDLGYVEMEIEESITSVQVTEAAPFTWTNQDAIVVKFDVPISGWKS